MNLKHTESPNETPNSHYPLKLQILNASNQTHNRNPLAIGDVTISGTLSHPQPRRTDNWLGLDLLRSAFTRRGCFCYQIHKGQELFGAAIKCFIAGTIESVFYKKPVRDKRKLFRYAKGVVDQFVCR